jgi:hypothetical protein
MSGGEVLVVIVTAVQAIVGIVKLTVLGLMKVLEGYVGQPAAGIILTAVGLAMAVLVLRAAGRRLSRRRAGRRLGSLDGIA